MKKPIPIRPLLRRPQRPVPHRLRRGSVLIVVLVVIMLLTFGVYGFTERMLAEAEAAEAYGRSVKAMASAQSGVELAVSAVSSRAADPEHPVSLYHVPELFSGIVMQPSASPAAVGRFALVAPVEGDPSGIQVRYGLVDESGKLNLNSIAAMDLDEYDEHYLLMALPGMTDDIADAILDYVDDDDENRPLGAESEYYGSLVPPAVARNGNLESLDELLLVRGVTPDLLYGEDANRNELLDPSENDGPAAMPLDDGDGFLRPGWSSFLTIHSRESNLKGDGSKKIYINQGLLTDLYDAIEPELGEDAARFIVAYRMYGPADGDESQSGEQTGDENGNENDDESSGGRQSSGNDDEGESGDGGSSGGGNRGPTDEEAAQMDQLAGGLAKAIGGADDNDTVTKGGLDLSPGAQFEVKSLYDLFDREVDVPADEEKGTEAETIASPWTSGGILTDYLVLLDMFSVTEATTFDGRINVNEARIEVLYGVPGMSPQLADSIVAARGNGQAQALSDDRRTTAWLVSQGIADLSMMRHFDKYLTGRGDVFRVQSVGFFDGGGPTARVEAVIDGTEMPAKIVSFRDLSDLGRGYAPSQLLQNAVPAGF